MNEKEGRLLTKYKKQLSLTANQSYIIYMLFVLSLVYIVDEISSNIYSALQSDMVTEFFVNGMGLEFNTGLATYSAMTAPFYAIMVITPFYKSLADKFGRKLFLAINTVGMGLGMFVCMMAENAVAYVCGIGIIYFLMGNDIQVLYVMETAPEKHRAKLTSITKAIALLGVTFIPMLRDLFMKNDGSQWQKVFMLPTIAGVIIGIVAFFIMPETPTYMKNKVALLEKSKDTNPDEKKEKTSDEAQGGVIPALKFIFKHKQTRAVLICAFLYMTSTGGTSYYESIMKTGGMSTSDITTAMYFIPVVNAIMTGLSGFITDYLGRKGSTIYHACFALVGLISFILTSSNGLSPVLVGVCYGLFIGGLWSACDILFIMIPGESSPTNLRMSVVGTMSILSGVGNVLSIAIMTVGMLFVESIGMLCLCVCVPFILVSMVILITIVHETKGVDLSTVTGSEWD